MNKYDTSKFQLAQNLIVARHEAFLVLCTFIVLGFFYIGNQMTKYSNQLKHPRWQKKRLEIFNRDNFTCTECGDNQTTLHVHHKEYRDCDAWDYPDELLITLCENCHKKKHPKLKDIVTNLLKDIGIYSKMIEAGTE